MIVPLFCFSQDDSIKATKPAFKLGLFYNNNIHYYGRTDSLKSAAVFPVAEVWLNENFYVTAIPVFISNQTGITYGGSVFTAGARFQEVNKYMANIYLVKPVYTKTSTLVQSALKFQLTGNYSWQNKVVNITTGGDVKLSDDLDYGATLAIDHLFRAGNNSKFMLFADPTISVNAGTQKFTQTSYKQSGILFLPGVQQQVSEEVKKFNLLSIEMSMPLILSIGKLQAMAIPSYVMPKNLVVVAGRPDLSERGEDMFSITAGIKFNF